MFSLVLALASLYCFRAQVQLSQPRPRRSRGFVVSVVSFMLKGTSSRVIPRKALLSVLTGTSPYRGWSSRSTRRSRPLSPPLGPSASRPGPGSLSRRTLQNNNTFLLSRRGRVTYLRVGDSSGYLGNTHRCYGTARPRSHEVFQAHFWRLL